MKTRLTYAAMTAFLICLFGTVAAWSQATAGKVQGRITSGGKPLANADVVLTNTDNARTYKMKTDKNGQFSAVGIQFGTYEQEITDSSGEKLFKTKVQITGEGGAVQDISAEVSAGKGGNTGPSAEERERIKANNEKAQSENALIAQLNPLIQAKNWAGEEPILTQLIALNPSRWDFQQALGDAQLNQGKFEDAIATYDKAIPMAQSVAKGEVKDPKADPAKAKLAVGQMLTNEGAAYTKLKKPDKAVEAYNKAAEFEPNPSGSYFNLCVTQYNSGNTDAALSVCDKAIAADPNKADAYYIKGSLLMGKSTQDKSGKLQAPEGTAEALNKYLELAPDGAHANDVKQMLTYIGAKIDTNYKAKKK
ncbi:MAG TPA: tetratricopeptide repeat protein [Candidatus Angelobacter sp.]|nr:tetratricopeptide repeat protein [Candidatus Angelobacter sp.]